MRDAASLLDATARPDAQRADLDHWDATRAEVATPDRPPTERAFADAAQDDANPADAVADASLREDATPPGPCSSGTFYVQGLGEFMRPGDSCMGCHNGVEATRFVVAGTVHGGLHDVTDCNGVAGVEVELTDAHAHITRLNSNSWGNFYQGPVATSIVPPYTARLRFNGRERAMVGSRTDLNCVHCHTAGGLNGAAGRLVAP